MPEDYVPIPTSVRAILGRDRSTTGGASFGGGAFGPGIPEKEAELPPYAVQGKIMFVELRRLRISTLKHEGDGDFSFNATDVDDPEPDEVMKSIHCEIDHTWIRNGTAPSINLHPGDMVALQGFVFWDAKHVDKAWHFFSGWEIHPVTAWRPE